jgi:hypothetical protein
MPSQVKRFSGKDPTRRGMGFHNNSIQFFIICVPNQQLQQQQQ